LGHAVHGEDGILVAVRGDLKTPSLTLAMEDEGDRYSAVLEGEAGVLRSLSLLLDWHVGRPLAKIGSVEMTPGPPVSDPARVSA
jgi:hypothetical protein